MLADRSFQLGDFELTSGKRSDYYIDCRTTTMHAHGQILIGQVGFEAIRAAAQETGAFVTVEEVTEVVWQNTRALYGDLVTS